ncbi:Circadian clock-controlled protein [Harpegnathos saltator]|uniref:Circadian clock-controlled protein n=1 Tax=Harpegnathos saltator TaxID=610380 RepID=E2BGV6_HARSA|nr:Circadian clock-controlled protein [Harpegnathos saltator]
MQPRAFVLTLTLPWLLLGAPGTAAFEDHFENCHPNTSGFDVCIREGLNAIKPYFKTGLPQYNVLPFDPFFAKEITAKRGIPRFGFTLTLRNITEHGWTRSKVTKFVSDLNNYKIVYTQSFPEKSLAGSYEFKAVLFSTTIISKGTFTMVLYDLIQTTTVTKLPGQKVRARMDVQNIRDMELHLRNLLSGKEFLENIIDKLINGAWQPGFVVTRGLINELVSTAFTEIFNTSFRNFPFERIFKPSPGSSNSTSTTSRTATGRY